MTEAEWFGPRPATGEQLELLRALARTTCDAERVEAAIGGWPPLTTGDAFALIDQLDRARRRAPTATAATSPSTRPEPVREAPAPAALDDASLAGSECLLGSREAVLPLEGASGRYRLKDRLQKLSPSIAACGIQGIGGWAGIYRWDRPGQAPRHGICKVMRCGRLWLCPVCAAHRRRKRTEELARGLELHTADGGGLVLVTLTYSHHQGDGVPLDTALDRLQQAWRTLTSGGPSSRERAEFGCHTVRALDLTHGRNGWHPHLHVLLLTDRPLTPAEHERLAASWRARWRTAVLRSQLGEPSDENGVRWQPLADAAHDVARAAGYLVKGGALERTGAAAELARVDVKRGRGDGLNPWQIAEIATGLATSRTLTQVRAVALWHEYAAAIRGQRALVMSRALLARLRLADEPEDGEAIVDNEIGAAVLVLPLSTADLKVLAATGRTGDVVDAAAAGGGPAARRALEHAHALSRQRGRPPDPRAGTR